MRTNDFDDFIFNVIVFNFITLMHVINIDIDSYCTIRLFLYQSYFSTQELKRVYIMIFFLLNNFTVATNDDN